jgi:hypothetical protein
VKRLLLMSCLNVSFLCLATTASAHHSFAMFDRTQTESIAGTVKEFDLINPHGWLRVMVPDAQGNENEWSVEMGGAGQVARVGLTPDAIHAGDKVTVQIHPLRDGSYGGQLVSVTLSSGKVLGQQRPGGPP